MPGTHPVGAFLFRSSRVLWALFRVLFSLRSPGPVRLRQFFEVSGGAFLKLGQILSLRQDILPLRYTRELLNLLSAVPPVPFAFLAAVFAEERGRPFGQIFEDETPPLVASGSIAQVYRSRLRETGETVAIKIQRPEVRETFEADFALIGFLAVLVDFLDLFSPVKVYEVVSEFVSWTRKELDFTYETKNGLALYEHSQNHPQTVIPMQYPLLSSERVLVQEFIENGVPLVDIISGRENPARLAALGISLDELALYIIEEGVRQCFIHGFFHADPHPANLLVLPGNRLVLLDFGIVGRAGPALERLHFLRALEGLSRGDAEAFNRHFLAMSDTLVTQEIKNYLNVDLRKRNISPTVIRALETRFESRMLADMHEIVDPWLKALDDPHASLYAKSASWVLFKVIRRGERYGLLLPREMILFFRALTILDMVALEISPRFTMTKALAQFFSRYPLKSLEEILIAKEAESRGREGAVENLTPMTEVDWEFFRELAAIQKERAFVARERVLEMIAGYAETDEEIRRLLKEVG